MYLCLRKPCIMLPLSMQYGPMTTPLPLKAKAASVTPPPPYCINYQQFTKTRLRIVGALGQCFGIVRGLRQRQPMPGQTIRDLRQPQPIFGQTIRGLRQCQPTLGQTIRGVGQHQPTLGQTIRGVGQPQEIPCGNGVLRVLFISGGLWHLRSGSCFQPPRFITLLPPPFPQGNPNL